MTLLVIGLGGAAGAISRYLASGWVHGLVGTAYPWGTLLVNLAGSLALGFAMIWFQHVATSPEVRYLVTVGFLGSFTTFSTFSYEATLLLRDGAWWRAGSYAAGSVLLGLAAVAVGAALASTVAQARG